MNKLQVRLVSPWTTRIETEDAVFCTAITSDKADALLCEWAPSPELFSFPRRKAWYCCEPKCQFNYLGGGKWPQIKQRLAPNEFLWHSHPDPRFRVPHITHFGELEMNYNQNRKQRAIAIVSNYGGSPWKRHPHTHYRNTLITSVDVDLYGRKGWTSYRRNWYSWPRVPKSYCGEIPGDWPSEQKRELMSTYKACVCLENMNEPWYFTEKFVEAVLAGCVPIYRPSENVARNQLAGAFWITPESMTSTAVDILKAIETDISLCQNTNAIWLQENQSLRETSAVSIFRRISRILSQ